MQNTTSNQTRIIGQTEAAHKKAQEENQVT